MATKKSFREQEYLRRAQEILAEREKTQQQTQTPASQSPQQKAAEARENAYLKALNAFVAQSNMNAPDSVKNRAGEVLAYAMQGDAQQKNTANVLLSGAGTRPNTGDVKNWDSNAARKAIIENETYIALMRNMGLYNTPEYATNSQYAYLAGDDYLSSYLEELGRKLEEAKGADAEYAAASEQYTKQVGAYEEAQRLYKDMQARGVLNNGAYTLEDLLSIDSIVNGTPLRSVKEFNSLPDDEWTAEYERMEALAAETDWKAYISAENAPKALEEHTSQVSSIEEQLGVVQGEIDRRSKIAELEELARSNPQFEELAQYAGVVTSAGQRPEAIIKMANGEGAYYIMNNADVFSDDDYYNRYIDVGGMPVPIGFLEGWTMATPDEVAIYNVLYHTDKDAAAEYLTLISSELTRRRAQLQESYSAVRAEDPLVGALDSAMTVLLNPAASANTLIGGLAGYEDANSYVYDMTRSINTTRTTYGQEVMGDLLKFDVLGQPVGTTIYNTLMSMGDMGMAYMTAGALSGGNVAFAKAGMQFIMSSEAAASTLHADLERGFTAEQALLHGIANGAVEALTERLPIDSLFSTDGKFLWRVFKSGLSEGGEEIASGVLQMGTDALISYMAGKESEVQSVYKEYAKTMSHEDAVLATLKHYAQDIALQGISGFASGGGLGTVTHTINDSQARTTGKTAQQQGDVDTLINIAEGMGEKSEAAKWAQRLKGKKEKGGRVSNYDVGRLTMALEQEVGTELAEATNKVMDEAIEGRLVELGETAENAKALAPIVRQTYRGQPLKKSVVRAVNWNDNAEQVVKELSRDTTAEEAGRPGVDWAVQAKAGGIEAVALAGEKADKFQQAAGRKQSTGETFPTANATTEAAKGAAEKGKELAKDSSNPTAKQIAFDDGTAGEGEIQRFTQTGGVVKAVIKTGDTTREVALEDITSAEGEGVATIVAYVQDEKNLHHQMSEQEASTMLQVYGEVGGNAQEFIEGYEAAYLAGYAGIEVPSTNLPANAAELAYKYGAQNAQADEANRSTRAGRRGPQGTGAVTWLGQVGSNADVAGTGGDISAAMENMTESQRTTVEVVQALAEKMQIDVVMFESTAENIAGIQNGSYQPGTNRIYIDVNAGAASQQGVQEQAQNGTLGYAMMKTLGHELTHYMESNSAEQYAAYKQAVKTALKEAGQDWARLVREKIDVAIRAGNKLTIAGAEAEVVADASEYMLQNSAFVKGLDSSVRGKVKTFVQGFMEKVRTIFANLTGGHRESAALRKTIDGVMQYTGNLQRLWDAGLREATGRNYAENATMRTTDTVQETARQPESADIVMEESAAEETAAEEWTAEEETEEELWTPEPEVLAPAEQLAEESYNEPAKAIAEERTVQEVIEEPTAQELQQEAKATQKIAPEELIKGIENRFGVDIKVVNRAALLASYDPDSRTILIGKNASTGEVLYRALGMELMRHAQNSQYAEQLKTAVMLAAYEGNPDGYFADLKTVADELNRRFDNYGKRKLTADSPIVQSEMFARMAAKVFGNESSMLNLIEQNFRKPTLLQRIRSALKGFVNKLRGLKSPAMTPIQRAEHLLGQALKDVQRAAANPSKGAQLLENFMDAHTEAADRQTVVAYTTLMGGDVELNVDDVTAGIRRSVPVENLTPTMQFSMDRDVEIREDGLMAVHNIKGPELESTLKLGGFPMPSIAIIKAKEGHTMYGEYSVIFGKQTIDPQASVKNRVYGADAWTPVFPRTETEVLDDVMYERETEAKELASQVDEEYGKKVRGWYSIFSGSDTTTETMEDLQNSAWNNDGMLAAYMTDNGKVVQILEKDVEVSRGYNPARADMYNHLLDIVDLADLVDMKARDLIDKYGDQLATEIPRPFARLNANWKQGDRQAGVHMVEIFKQATAYEGSGRDTSVKTEKAKDYYATGDAMRSSIDRADFNKWIKGKLQDAFGMQGIYNGRERFTPTGNRRSFKQLHDEVTAANVVKAMASQEESNIPTTDAAGLMAAASSMYKSIAEIKADAGRLGKISDEEYNARIAKANNAHHDLLNEIEAWDYTQIEQVGELLVQAAKKRMDSTAIAAMLKRNGYKATQKAGKMAADLIHQVQTIPSGYFEAKPARVVDFDEIKMVIAPEDMPESLATQLDKLGIPYTTYDGTDADRLEKSNAVEDAQFSMRDAYGNEFAISEKEIENNKRDVANMQPIVRITGNKFAKQEGKDFKTMALEYFGEEGTTAQSELLGPIAIDKAGIEHLISSLTWRRSALLPAIKPVIENGRIIQVEKNHKGYGFDTALIAGVVNLDGKDYYMGVAVRERNDGSNGYYIHDAVMVEKRSPLPNKSGLVTAGEKAPTLAIILADLANYNTQFAEEKKFSTRDLPEETTVREYLAEADDSMAATVEERNALEIYQNRLKAHENATIAVEEAERAMKGADGEALKIARAELAKARAEQKEEYNRLIKLENTEHVQSVMQRTQQFISEEIAGKTSEDIAGMIAEREQQIRQLEQDLEGLKGAARAQQKADIREHKRVVRALKNKATYKLEQKTKEYRAREQKAREYRRTRDEVNKLRRSIGRKVKRLNTLRVRETDQKHVPQEYQAVVDAVMRTFTDSSLSRLAFSAEKTARLQRTYGILKELESDMAYYWDDEIAEDIERLTSLSEDYTALRTREGGVPSTYSLEGVQLETKILRGVDAIVSNVTRMIDSANDAFIAGRTATFEEYASETGDLLLKQKDAKRRGEFLKGLDEMLRTGNMTPVYFIEHLNNPMIKEVFDQIRKGQSEYGKIIAEGKAFVQAAKNKYHYGRWVGDGSLRMETAQGHTITLTREQAAWVYATAKREASNKLMQTEHLLVGGFEYKDIKTAGKDVLDKPHQLDAADVAKIGEWLTDEQKAYADELVGFLSDQMAEYGNQASMDMFGYKKFLEQYYFPFKTKADQRYQRGDEGAGGEDAGTGRMKNSGFTKKLQHKANATLVMDDFTTVVTDHIQQMAMYSAMVEPIENLKRLLNYKVMEEDGTIQTVRALIGQKYGEPAQKYLTQLLKDLNGAAQGDTRATKGVNYLISAFKRGAVMASASVVLQQPTAAARAMAYVNPKYFLNNPFYRPSKGLWEKMMKYSGTAVIKDMGKFDVGLGLTASQYVSDEHLGVFETYRRLKNESRTKAGKAAYDRFMERLTAAPGLADQWTWGLIWQAVEKEQAALHPQMDRSSDEFLRLVGQRFDDVIDHTQVYDSVLTRSNLMRSKNAFHQMATSFMAEPTLSLNMLYDMAKGKHTPKQRAAILGSVVASQVLAGAMAALVQAWNDDDDKRNWLEKYTDRAVGNIFDNLNPLGMIPYVSDIISLLQGYDVERPDMTVAADIIQYGERFFKAFEDGGAPTYKQVEDFVGTLTNMLGVPYKNISREVRRTWNAITGTDWSEPNMTNVGFVAAENVSIFGFLHPWGGEKKDYYERMISAMEKGDAELVEDYRTYLIDSKAVDPEKMPEGLRDVYKERYLDGGIAKADAVAFMAENGLAEDQKAAFTYVDKWEEGGENPTPYKSIRLSIWRNDMDAVDEEIAELLDNGWTAAQVYNALKADVDEHYMLGSMSQEEYKHWYNTHAIAAGKEARSDNDWYWVFKELDWGKANGGSTEGYDMHAELWTAVESGTNLRATINDYQNHGRTREQLNSALNNHYKQQLIDLYRTNRAEFTRLQSRVLTAYEALGYDRKQKLKTIQGWLE